MGSLAHAVEYIVLIYIALSTQYIYNYVRLGNRMTFRPIYLEKFGTFLSKPDSVYDEA